MTDARDIVGREGFAPCPTCHQYSHSLGSDAVTDAFNHFHTLIAHPVRGHPMGSAFDDTTKNAAQVLTSAIASLRKQLEDAREALLDIEAATARKQLPLTAQINARAIEGLEALKGKS